jgi:O-methyltransferase
MYGSTIDAISALYPGLSSGGYVVIDDYFALSPCRQAVDDYRAEHGIVEPIERIDWTGAYWRKEQASA